jgi:signal transduction histidine kinase
MYGPALLHLALKFTGFHNRRGLRALWGLTLVIGLGLSAAVLLGASRGLLLIGHPAVRLLLGVQILGSLLVCVALSFAAARPPHPLGLRRRARVLAVACLVSFGLPALSLVLPAAGDSVPVILALLASFPAMMGYAIVRLGMFDIRVVIGQGLLYISLSLVVLLGYLGLVWVAIQVLGGAAERPAIVGGAAVMAVLVLSLVQLRVQDWINRRVFRSRYVLGDALAEASRVLAHSHSEQEVVRTLRSALLDTMQLSRAVLALQIPGSHELRCITLGSRPDPITGELPAPFPDRIDPRGVRPLSRSLGSTEATSAHDSQAASAQLAADPDDGARGTGRDEASFWPHYGLEWIVPLRPGDHAQQDQQRAGGLLLLGPKLDGRLLDRSDRALVATLGNQLAVALDNARAFEEIRRLKDGLEEQVEERTRDLTEALDQLKRTQGQLVESEKQALLGRVVAGIVHEINSPLGSLRSAVDTSGRLLSRLEVYVQRHERAGDAEAARLLSAIRAGKPLLSVMQQSGERIDGLVESLKRFVSLDEHEMRPLDVREGIDSALTLLSPMLGDRIQVTRSYPTDPPVVQCYPARLNQVFLNLIENAVEAVDDEGEIEIHIGRENGHVEVEVRDNGRGIEADRLASLFDFGFVNKDGRVRMRLGLPSNKRTVEELGGSLQVDSRTGRGTSVRVELPAPADG